MRSRESKASALAGLPSAHDKDGDAVRGLCAAGGILCSHVTTRKGLLVKLDETQHIPVFVSHTWWLRPKAATGYDAGQPDYQDGDKAHLKFRVTVRGVERLIEERGLDRSKVVLWIDWFSIEQDDRELKLAGIQSLIRYVTRCEYMLIPVEVEQRIRDLKHPYTCAYFRHLYALGRDGGRRGGAAVTWSTSRGSSTSTRT
jgi:hypothetical protein